jgi:hypothetical protein
MKMFVRKQNEQLGYLISQTKNKNKMNFTFGSGRIFLSSHSVIFVSMKEEKKKRSL